MLLDDLQRRGANLHCPKWLPTNTQYLCRIGGKMYGYSDDDGDNDIYGFCIPPKEIIFPHLTGAIFGFGTQPQNFDQYQKHHINMPDNGEKYDLTVFSIIKFFELCRQGNPNFLTVLFVPQNHILHMTQIGNFVRENRKLFLHKGCFHRYKGYAYQQIHKMKIKNPDEQSGRRKYIEQFGYDVKFALHCVRLLLECEMILAEGDLDVQRHVEQLKSIKRGDWEEDQVYRWFNQKERDLEKLYADSKLPHSANEEEIKAILIKCFEMHYGDLSKEIVKQDSASLALKEIEKIIERFKS